MSNKITQRVENDWVRIEEFHALTKKIMHLGTLRTILADRKNNEANFFCRKIGKRLILSPSRFYVWMDKIAEQQAKEKLHDLLTK